MGAASSTPKPLLHLHTEGGPILVPPGSALSIHPPLTTSRTKPSPYTGGPVYHPAVTPQRRPQGRRHVEFEGSEDSESTVADMDGMDPRMMGGRGGFMPGGGGMMGARGPMMGGRGRGGMMGSPRMDPRGAMGMGMTPGSPRMGMNMKAMGSGAVGGGMGFGHPGGMGQGIGGGMGPGGSMGMPPDMPPGYSMNPQMPPRYGGGMPATGMSPYATYPQRPPSSQSSEGNPAPPQQTHRPPKHEHVPMGTYTGESDRPRRPSRSRSEPQTSAKLNRGQPSDRKVGPSGKEWLDGDAFLDACVCTTGCKCRKSQRVLYRARKDRARGGDADNSDPEYSSGEIRYILKDDLGRDCGDHSACRKSSDVETEKESKKNKKGKKKEEKERKEHFAGFKEELLEAFDERFEGLKKESRQQGKAGSISGSPFRGPGMGPSPFMMDPSAMDPRMAQQMGMAMGGNPYSMGMPGMGRMYPGMEDPMGRHAMNPTGIPMGPMANGSMPFEDEMSMDDMDIRNPYLPQNLRGRKARREIFRSPRATARERDMGLDMDTEHMATLYGRGPGTRGRGGIAGGRRGGRRPRFDSESDGFDIGPSSRRKQGDRDEDEAAFGDMMRGGFGDDERRHAASPRRGRGGQRLSRDRGKQARADTDDEDAY